MTMPRTFRTTASLLALCLAAPVLAAPSAQVFDAVKKPESIDPAWRAHLCALLPQPCEAGSLALLRPRGAAAGDYVALSEAPLAMARIRRRADTKAWQLDRLHDFTAYAAEVTKEAGGNGPELRFSLAPALYPLAEGQWAAAVLQTRSEMYAGGGASFSTADFVPLDATQAAYEGIPFACGKMVRACFSAQDYKHSRHCHDESNGSLRIAYGEPAKAGAPYGWQYTWLQSEWAQDTPASATTTTRIRFTANTTERADFCGGPQ